MNCDDMLLITPSVAQKNFSPGYRARLAIRREFLHRILRGFFENAAGQVGSLRLMPSFPQGVLHWNWVVELGWHGRIQCVFVISAGSKSAIHRRHITHETFRLR